MGPSFLCSRSELFRSLHLDTGSRPLFINTPPSFLEWIDKVLPMDAVMVGPGEPIPEDEKFGSVLLWSEGPIRDLEPFISALRDRFKGSAQLFIVASPEDLTKKEGLLLEDGRGPVLDPLFLLTTTEELFHLLEIEESD